MSTGMGGHQGPDAETVEWYTPPSIFAALGEHFTFDLDPAHPFKTLAWVPARTTYSREEDGLAQRWFGRVWLNPPYGRETEVWLERFVEHHNGIALVFARTETRWFHRLALACDAWCFIRDRITFVREDGLPAEHNSGAPSMLLACGQDCVEAVALSELGIMVAVENHVPAGQTTIFQGAA